MLEILAAPILFTKKTFNKIARWGCVFIKKKTKKGGCSMQEKLNGYLEAMKAEREQVLNKDINAIVEEKVNAYREKVFAEAQAEVRAEVAVYDIRIDTVEGIIKELATEATTIE